MQAGISREFLNPLAAAPGIPSVSIKTSGNMESKGLLKSKVDFS